MVGQENKKKRKKWCLELWKLIFIPVSTPLKKMVKSRTSLPGPAASRSLGLPGGRWDQQTKVTTSSLNCRVTNHLGVSLNGGTPKSSISIGFSIINHPFWGTTILGNTHLAENLFVDTNKDCTDWCLTEEVFYGAGFAEFLGTVRGT